MNVFNGDEPSVSYLQLPVKKKEENHFCTRCGETRHWRQYCQMATWCKFCMSETHATQACRRYEKFVKDNPIASSRRNTPVQEQKLTVNIQELTQKLLFPHPPTQCFNPPVIPQIEPNNMRLQEEKCESREHSQKSPQIQVKEGQISRLRQPPHQRSCLDVCMDPRYQKPPHYSQIQHHRSVPQLAVEVNEIGPTIQQGVIQRPVQRDTQSTDVRQMNAAPLVDTRQTVTRVPSSNTTDASVISDPGEDGRNRQPEPERDPNHNGYVLNCVHENRPLTLNNVARPVFVNHYYAGDLFMPTTSKKLIKLDECDTSIDNSRRNIQSQGTECECREYSRNLLARQ